MKIQHWFCTLVGQRVNLRELFIHTEASFPRYALWLTLVAFNTLNWQLHLQKLNPLLNTGSVIVQIFFLEWSWNHAQSTVYDVIIIKCNLILVEWSMAVHSYLVINFVFVFESCLDFRYKLWQKLGSTHLLTSFCIVYHYIISLKVFVYTLFNIFVII